jgi:hypothetical protein
MTRVRKRPGVWELIRRPVDDGDVVGPAERELVADRALEPLPARLRAVEDARVGQLELAEGELVAVAAGALLLRERAREQMLPAAEEAPDVLVAEPGADRFQRLGVRAGAEAVVERLEAQPGPLGLALRPLVTVQTEPVVVGRRGAGLDEGGAPVGVAEVEVGEVGKARLAGVLEVGVAVRAPLAPAAPGAGLLLGNADHDAAEAALPPGALQVGTGDLLLVLALLKPHDRNLVVGGEAFDRPYLAAPDLAEQRRRGDREAPVQEEADQHPRGHQPRHVGMEQEAVDGADMESDAVAQ